MERQDLRISQPHRVQQDHLDFLGSAIHVRATNKRQVALPTIILLANRDASAYGRGASTQSVIDARSTSTHVLKLRKFQVMATDSEGSLVMLNVEPHNETL
jgi:hypothetical protein